MQDILNIIYGKVETLHELTQQVEKLVAPIKNDPNFHKIAGDIIPEKFREGPMGYEFLKILLGERQANKLHIRDQSLDHMRMGEGI